MRQMIDVGPMIVLPDSPSYIIERCAHERRRRTQQKNEVLESPTGSLAQLRKLASEYLAIYDLENRYRKAIGMRELTNIPLWVLDNAR